jgi:hypothetical protein
MGTFAPLRSFIIVLAAAAGTVLLLVGFNLVVDPYSVRPSDAFLKLRLKSRKSIEKNEYLHKAYAIASERPETVYLGSSRVCLGLPADDELWGSRTYNCGLTAAEPEEVLAYLRHALSLGGVKRVVFGIDGFNYLGPHVPPPTFDPALLLTRPGQHMRPAFASPGIFSMGAVGDSVKTLIRQRNSDQVTYPKGVRDPDGIRRDIKGDSEWAAQKLLDVLRGQLTRLAAQDPATDVLRLDYARAMAALCKEQNVEVVVVFLPIHQRYLELVETKGVLPRVDAVKEQVKAIFQNAGLRSVAVYDFSKGQPHALDTTPEEPGSGVWKWWWEVSHFRAEFGRELIEQMAAGARAKTP